MGTSSDSRNAVAEAREQVRAAQEQLEEAQTDLHLAMIEATRAQMDSLRFCYVCKAPFADDDLWIGHQRLAVRWHRDHGISEPICGEDVSGHTLLFGQGVS